MSAACPPYPEKRTSTDATSMSASCHLLPYAVQQWYQHGITSSASSSNHSEMLNPDRLAGGVKLDIGNPVRLRRLRRACSFSPS
jgi:hypothetical protein